MSCNTQSTRSIQDASVVGNQHLCREHLRLTLRVSAFADARPGQFVHIGAALHRIDEVALESSGCSTEAPPDTRSGMHAPVLLRRAFSIAGIETDARGSTIEIIYRVVGRGTRWMASLLEGDVVSVLGPLGQEFPILTDKPVAYLVAGGVGLGPVLCLAETLAKAGKKTVALCGARTADLFPLSVDRANPPAKSARQALPACVEFARHGVPVVLSTDDGSLGFAGHVGEAFAEYHRANPVAPDDIVVYTCGPELMMRFVADFCERSGITCYVCMERSMACGMGTCQSCVVPVRDESDADGWRYELCCTDGPVFEAHHIVWDCGTSRRE